MRLSPAALAFVIVAWGADVRAQSAAQAPAGEDLIAIEVQAVDATGHPVVGLTPEQLDVTVDGQPRRVVSARFVSLGAADAAAPPEMSRRLFVLAIDLASFSPIESIGMIVAAQGFVDRIPATDRVAIVTYPEGTTTDPTTDRVAIRRMLEGLVGRRPDPVPASAASRTAPDPAPRSAHTVEELPRVLERIRPLPGRKIVVLVSPATAEASVVPENRELIAIGRQATQAGAILYTLLVDSGFIDVTIPEKERPLRSAAQSEAVTAHEQWLGQLSAAAGGWLMPVAGLNPEPAYDRLLDETSGYYILAVDAAGLSRDGQLHLVSVTPKGDGVAVRARRWVLVAAEALPPYPAAANARPRAGTNGAAPRAASAASADPILGAFERGEYGTAQERLARTPDLARWIRDHRDDKPPWPDVPGRAAVLALEVASVALYAENVATRDESIKLLLKHASALPRAQGGDSFTCAWYWAALMLFEGSERADAAWPFVTRASSQCAGEARVVLAAAVLTDLRSPVLTGMLRVGTAAAAEEAAHRAVMAAYEAAMKFPENEAEARVRAAWRLYRLNRHGQALALLEAIPTAASAGAEDSYRRQLDQQVRYLGHLIKGHLLRALDRAEDAAAAYRLAIQDWPSAQSPRIALMTLVGTRGRGREAAALAAEIERAPDDASDPWWWFWQGDRPLYPALIARLREEVQ